MEEIKDSYIILVGKPIGDRQLGRSIKQDNIKMDLKEIGCEHMSWIYLAQDMDQWLL
jgi:hypothetical protein